MDDTSIFLSLALRSKSLLTVRLVGFLGAEVS